MAKRSKAPMVEAAERAAMVGSQDAQEFVRLMLWCQDEASAAAVQLLAMRAALQAALPHVERAGSAAPTTPTRMARAADAAAAARLIRGAIENFGKA